MDSKELAKLGGTVTKISVFYARKIGDGNYGSVGGQFGVEADLASGADPDRAMDAVYAYVKEAATRNLKPSFDAVKPKDVPLPAARDVPQEPPGGPVAQNEPKQAPLSAPAPSAQIPPNPTAERIFDIAADDTVQLKVADTGKKMLLFRVGPFKKHGITCWPEVAQARSELDGCWQWPVAQAYLVESLGIRQVVVSMKASTNDSSKQVPDKVLVIR